MKSLRMKKEQAATILMKQARITPDSRVIVMGSNYNIFKTIEPDRYCTKCADTLTYAEPQPVDLFTFEISLLVRKLLLEKGVSASLLLMPSDFMKGADGEVIKVLRAAYELPSAFRNLLDRYQIPEVERAVILESTFKARAQRILKKIRRQKCIPIHEEERDEDITLLARGELGSFREIPLGRVVERYGNKIPIPFCQVICSAFYERLAKQGYTDFIGIFNDTERVCINQGTTLAQFLGYLKMEVLLATFSNVQLEEAELIGLNSYGLSKPVSIP